jgi:Protein of unknown function (DUF3326)
MKLENRTIHLPLAGRGMWLSALSRAVAEELGAGAYPLRLSIAEVRERGALAEVTVLSLSDAEARQHAIDGAALLTPRRKEWQAGPFAVVQVVPTGVRCEFGGYAGDACPATNLLAAAADVLITHPNAVNASDLNEMAPGVLYVEGKTLDDFLLGHLGLLRVAGNRIGTFVDPRGLGFLDEVTSAFDAARTAGGLDCGVYVVLRETLGVSIGWSETGCAVGTVANPEVVVEAVQALLADGVQAIGGLSVIDGVTHEMFARHMRGEIPNPSGGVEAILTHMVSTLFRVPTAHAPLPYYQHLKRGVGRDPRASAEFISTPHYVSVLKGLARAPRPVPLRSLSGTPAEVLTVNNVGAVVVPASCLGGIPALAAEFSDIPLIAVTENRTILDVTNAKMKMANVIAVASYLEAAGVVLALRNGISLESLRRPIAGARRLELPAAAKEARTDPETVLAESI